MRRLWSLSSPAQRGRGTARSVVEGVVPGAEPGLAPSTASRSPMNGSGKARFITLGLIGLLSAQVAVFTLDALFRPT